MAKYERHLTGDFNEVLALCERAINKSESASYEDGSDYRQGNFRVAVRVYERYSMAGSNRVSLSLTLIDLDDGELFLSAITSGGSQAMFFKINTWGEESFLKTLRKEIEAYAGRG